MLAQEVPKVSPPHRWPVVLAQQRAPLPLPPPLHDGKQTDRDGERNVVWCESYTPDAHPQREHQRRDQSTLLSMRAHRNGRQQPHELRRTAPERKSSVVPKLEPSLPQEFVHKVKVSIFELSLMGLVRTTHALTLVNSEDVTL